ncbi:hypothetical protein CBS101457_004338 [Exobasidium rhododendri]|nr:hypothetical protein CBS101457_004338 [Exobasidium rhododendri]
MLAHEKTPMHSCGKSEDSILKRMYQRLSWVEPSGNTDYGIDPALMQLNVARGEDGEGQIHSGLHLRLNSPLTVSSLRSNFLSSARPIKPIAGQDAVNAPNRVQIHLDQVNENGIYRPGDTVRGTISLDQLNVVDRPVRSIHVKLMGEVIFSRYEPEASTASGQPQKIIRARKHTFLASQIKLPIDRKRYADTETESKAPVLPFALNLPYQDDSSPLSESSFTIDTNRRGKFIPLPPTCKIQSVEYPSSGKRNKRDSYRAGKLFNLMQAPKKDPLLEVRYYIVADVQWQRSLLQRNQLIARIEVVFHPSPPATAAVPVPFGGNQSHHRTDGFPTLLPGALRQQQNPLFRSHGRHSSDQQPSLASSLSPSVDTILSMTRPISESYSSSLSTVDERSSSFPIRRHTRNVSSIGLPGLRTLLSGRNCNTREVELMDSSSGPRGWYVQRRRQKINAEVEALIEFVYPATPYYFMGEDIPFRLKITCASTGLRVGRSNGAFQLQGVRFRLLRHTQVNSPGGKLIIEKGLEVKSADGKDSIIQVSNVKVQDMTPAPSDEYCDRDTVAVSCEYLSGTFRVGDGLREAQSALKSARKVELSAVHQHKEVKVEQPGASLTTPSFYFKGILIDYTIEVEVTMAHVQRSCASDPSNEEKHALFKARAATPSIKLSTRPPTRLTVQEALGIQGRDRFPSRTSRSSTSPTTTSRASAYVIRRVPVALSLLPDGDASHHSAPPNEEVRTATAAAVDSVSNNFCTPIAASSPARKLPCSKGYIGSDNAEQEGDADERLAHLNVSPFANLDLTRFPSSLDDDNNFAPLTTSSARERSSTLSSQFSQLSDQTLESLPPAYAL